MSNLVRNVYQRLLIAYGPQGWWPAESVFEVMIGAVLTQACTWVGVEKALASLKVEGLTSANAISTAPIWQLAKLIRPTIYYNAKAHRLKSMAEFYINEFNGNPLEVSEVDTETLREMLLSVYGVGEETADDILLYAFKRPVFIVDNYTRRLAKRLGFRVEKMGYRRLSRLFSDAMPSHAAVLGEYHALIVRHSKEHCRKIPSCYGCPLGEICPTGLSHTSSAIQD